MPEQVVVCELPCHSVAKDAACCSRLVSGLLESLKKKKDKKKEKRSEDKIYGCNFVASYLDFICVHGCVCDQDFAVLHSLGLVHSHLLVQQKT